MLKRLLKWFFGTGLKAEKAVTPPVNEITPKGIDLPDKGALRDVKWHCFWISEGPDGGSLRVSVRPSDPV